MKEQVIELAKQAGDDWDSTRREDKEFLIRFYALVRNAALEQAINACNVEASAAEHAANSQAEYGADCCACAIRNLKEPTP